jgi:hypothetical protein
MLRGLVFGDMIIGVEGLYLGIRVEASKPVVWVHDSY